MTEIAGTNDEMNLSDEPLEMHHLMFKGVREHRCLKEKPAACVTGASKQSFDRCPEMKQQNSAWVHKINEI